MNFGNLKSIFFVCLFAAFTFSMFSIAARAEVVVVLNSGDGTVSLIDKTTMVETKRIPVGKEPHHLMATADDQFLIAPFLSP